MKQLLLGLFMLVAFSANSQQTNLTVVNTVKVKKGQRMAFEAAYKLHIAKFHTGKEKNSVFQIINGRLAGAYHLVNSGRSFSDLDNERGDASAHNLDLDKNFFPYLEETTNGYYNLIDSLSFRPEMVAEKFVVTVRHMKQGMQGDWRQEQARAMKILAKMKGKFWEHLSLSTFAMLWDGSDQVNVTIRNLVDGFASLESGFYGPPGNGGNPSFKEEYIKEYGTLDWDKRTKILDEAEASSEQYIMRLRKDLSSQ